MRGKKEGVDCVGLIIAACVDLGISKGAEAITGYSRMPNEKDFDHWCSIYTQRLPCNRLQPIHKQILPGDLVSFWIEKRGVPRHIAVYTGLSVHGEEMMIHSLANEERGVIECVIDPSFWTRRVSSFYRLNDFM
jgi:cell wall-associated NlpC family hydrolase